MAVYSKLFAMTIQSTRELNELESSFSTAIWDFENQRDDAILGAMHMNNNRHLYMTHVDIKLYQHYGDDEIGRGQNEIKSERVEECYASPSFSSLWLELDSPVYNKYQAIDSYDMALTCHLNRTLLGNVP